MIFSSLFKEKWQSKNALVRIQAVAEDLDVSNAKNRETLRLLIENDTNVDVRKSALLKLNSIDAWYEASKANSLSTIRQFAAQEVESILLGRSSLKLSVEEKFAFLDKQPKPQLLEQWLFVESNDNLLITLYETLAKPQIITRLFKEHSNQALLTYIVDQCDDISVIEKLLKKVDNENIEKKLLEKRNQLVDAVEIPKKILKSAQLTLSKYLALKDESDYQAFITRKTQLKNDWLATAEQIEVLDCTVQDELVSKWDNIDRQLTQIFAKKAEQFEQHKIELQLKAEKKAQKQAFKQSVTNIGQQLSTAIFENSDIDHEAINHVISENIANIETSPLTFEDKTKLINELSQYKIQLNQLDMIAESVATATYLISKMSQFSAPSNLAEFVDKYPIYEQWRKEWKAAVRSSATFLPESIMASFHSIDQTWDKESKQYLTSLSQKFKKARKKLFDVKRLINNGKYNAAFGVFKHVKNDFDSLLPCQKDALEKELTQCQALIDELADWEHYVATPKKQKLLNEIIAIVEQPLSSPIEQANKVKQFRKQWNRLGHAEEALEHQLNDAFNEACEQAFSPCRIFFAEQEKLRAQHLIERENIIVDIKQFVTRIDSEKFDYKQLETELNRFKQRWKNAGEIDKKSYQDINKSFKNSIKPLQEKVTRYQQENAHKKEQLIELVKSVVTTKEIFEAIKEVKSVQLRWKEIGYAGKNERILWQEFKQLTDELFNNRDKELNERKSLEKTSLKQLASDINKIGEAIQNSLSLEKIQELSSRLNSIRDQLETLTISATEELKLIAKLLKNLSQLKSSQQKEQQNKHWQALFSVLKESIDSGTNYESIPHFDDIETHWKKLLISLETKSSANFKERLEKTIAIEIISENKNEDQDSELTMKVQVYLMQEQLSTGRLLSLESAVKSWLVLGKFSSEDIPLIERVEKALIN